MSKPDLDTVAARRAAVLRELAALDKMRVQIEAENEDLAVAERVLKRLASLPAEENAAEAERISAS